MKGFLLSLVLWQRLQAVAMLVLALCISCLLLEGNFVPFGDVLSVNAPWHAEQFPVPVLGSR